MDLRHLHGRIKVALELLIRGASYRWTSTSALAQVHIYTYGESSTSGSLSRNSNAKNLTRIGAKEGRIRRAEIEVLRSIIVLERQRSEEIGSTETLPSEICR
ncbi:hypothetical protein NL676_000283 [Syzygium grande]|nr:hypothetical protein NL676_000283 [Syzygium grande]